MNISLNGNLNQFYYKAGIVGKQSGPSSGSGVSTAGDLSVLSKILKWMKPPEASLWLPFYTLHSTCLTFTVSLR